MPQAYVLAREKCLHNTNSYIQLSLHIQTYIPIYIRRRIHIHTVVVCSIAYYRQIDSKIKVAIAKSIEPARVEYDDNQVLLYSSFVTSLNAIILNLIAQQTDIELEVAINQHYEEPKDNKTNTTATTLALALLLITTTAIAIRIAIALAQEVRKRRAQDTNRNISDNDFFDLSRCNSDSAILALVTALVTTLVIALSNTNRNIPDNDINSDLYSDTNTAISIYRKLRYLLQLIDSLPDQLQI